MPEIIGQKKVNCLFSNLTELIVQFVVGKPVEINPICNKCNFFNEQSKHCLFEDLKNDINKKVIVEGK